MPAYDPYQGVSPLPWVQVPQAPAVPQARISRIRPAAPLPVVDMYAKPFTTSLMGDLRSKTPGTTLIWTGQDWGDMFSDVDPFIPPGSYPFLNEFGDEMWTMPDKSYFE